jgi:tRNA(fMet)-specific endonuclease VapC
MNFVLDTNILIHAIKESSVFTALESEYSFFESTNSAFISSVTIGELYSFALQNKWGVKRWSKINLLLKKMKPIPVESENLIMSYAQIDAFSNGNHPVFTLGMSARNMGKNDLWIAATTLFTKSTLITTDKDFNHLHNVFFKVNTIKV